MDAVKIIGIGGLPRSGKDTMADLLLARGYFGFSLGDYTRRYSQLRHSDKPDPISVANMTETANWLRRTYGPDVNLRAALTEFADRQKAEKKYRGLVLYSIRAPIEVDFILSRHGQLIWLEASTAVRYRRALANLRPGELSIDQAEFKRQEDLQWKPQPGLSAAVQMNIAYVRDHATRVLTNNDDDISAFRSKVLALITELENSA